MGTDKKPQQYLGWIVIWVCLLIMAFNFIHKQVVKHYQDKYDFAYNRQRQKLGIPIIPANWHIKEHDDVSAYWCGDEKEIGHKRKMVTFSGCVSDGELDVYNLPNQDKKQRWLEIEYNYKKKPQPDSVSYTYQIDHSAKVITRKFADSLFNAEHINKDY